MCPAKANIRTVNKDGYLFHIRDGSRKDIQPTYLGRRIRGNDLVKQQDRNNLMEVSFSIHVVSSTMSTSHCKLSMLQKELGNWLSCP